MKLLRVSLLIPVLALTSASIFAEAPAVKMTAPHAADVKGFSLATIDMTKIFDPQDPSKSQSLEWKDIMSNFQKNLEKEQKPLLDLQAKIEAERVKLEEKTKKGEKVTNEEQSHLMTMFQELQTKSQQLQPKIEAQFSQIQKDFKAKIDAAIKAVGDKSGYDVIIFKDALVYVKSGIHDVTSAVITELNSKYEAEKRAKKMTAPAPAAAKAKA